MLPAAYRLRRRAEFAATVRVGRRGSSGGLVVHLALPMVSSAGSVCDGTGDVPSRVGFVVPKAVGSAVVRNKVRRRLRHLMRPRLLDLPPAAAVVVRVLPGAAGLSSEGLAEQLDTALTIALRRWTGSSRSVGGRSLSGTRG